MALTPHIRGGRDVPIVDGGTGESTASPALIALGGLDVPAHNLLDHTGLTGLGLLLQVPLESFTSNDLFTTLDHDLDDSPPLTTETGIALTLSYTPTIVGSTTFIWGVIHIGMGTAPNGVGAGLWLNSESGPRSWSVERIIDTGTVKSFMCRFRFAHTNLDLQTWRLRYSGNNTGFTCRVNRSGIGPLYANTLITSLSIKEIQE